MKSWPSHRASALPSTHLPTRQRRCSGRRTPRSTEPKRPAKTGSRRRPGTPPPQQTRPRCEGAVLPAHDNGLVRRLQQAAVLFVPLVLVGSLALWLDAVVPEPDTLFPRGVPGAQLGIAPVTVPATGAASRAQPHRQSKQARVRPQGPQRSHALRAPAPPPAPPTEPGTGPTTPPQAPSGPPAAPPATPPAPPTKPPSPPATPSPSPAPRASPPSTPTQPTAQPSPQ